MPGFYDGNAAYHRLIRIPMLGGAKPGDTLGKGSYFGLKGRTQGFLGSQSADEQFERDTAMWYGAIIQSGKTWKSEMLKRLFSVLYFGGLMAKRQTGWVAWANQRVPICASISHGCRVLIWLPENDGNGEFWTWLWAGHEPEKRAAATHGVESVVGPPVDIAPPNHVMKGIQETKGNKNVNHYGVNLAMGGFGNMNPISGKTIADNGKHGHLYLAYNTTMTQGSLLKFNRQTVPVARRALLVGTEQSSPFDRQEAVKGTAGAGKTFFTRGINVPDQYGGGHGLGGHSRFGATGGDDFSYKDKPTHLGDYGPARGFYYDGLYIDLTQSRWNQAKRQPFEVSMLGGGGVPPLPARG
jgi:hypothetical protein